MPVWIRQLPLLLILPIAFNNCAKTTFSSAAADTATTAAAASCTDTLAETSVPVKTLFVVDTSGSNADDAFYYGSDGSKTLRGGSIARYFSTYANKSNFAWGFDVFSGATARSLISTGFGDATYMQSALNSFYSVTDIGLTPYRAALALARSTIAADTGAANTKYIVVFLSDGLPDPEVADSVLASDIAGILALRPGQITFNAIYYGSVDAVASARLKAMTVAGSGQFLDANTTGGAFTISDVVNVAGVSCAQ